MIAFYQCVAKLQPPKILEIRVVNLPNFGPVVHIKMDGENFYTGTPIIPGGEWLMKFDISGQTESRVCGELPS